VENRQLQRSHCKLSIINCQLIIIFIMFFSINVFSQSMTSAQMAQFQAQMQAQAGQTSSMMRATEIAAAREILNAQNFKNKESPFIMDSSGYYTLFKDQSKDTIFSDTSAFRKKFMRYESVIFSQSLPSAFYEVQGIVPADYPLKPGDNLELSLWGAVEKQFSLSVNNQGNVFVEGAGLINVTNLNLGEAEKIITKKLQSIYSGIVQGRISVNLRTTKLSPTKIFVMGSVQRPGGYDLPGNANVFLALYRAGGSDEHGSVRNIVVRRANGDSTKIDLYNFLLKGQKIGEGVLRDGDMVFIPKAEKLVKVTGAIGKPAIYELKNNETLSDLLTFAGGLLPNTDHTVNLWRINEVGSPEVLEPGLAKDFANNKKEFQMQNGDSIFVFTSTKPNINVIQVSGSVFYPSHYKWTEGMLVKDAVTLAGGFSTEAFTDRIIVERINADSSFSYLSDDYNSNNNLKLLPNDNVVVLDSRRLKNWRMISVVGYVKEPRDFEWQENLNALDLLILCGGFMPNASKSEIMIERLVEGEQGTKIITLPLKEGMTVKNDKRLALMPGDRVVIKADTSYYEPEVISLTGAIKNPGSYSLVKRGETLKNFMKRTAIMDPAAFIKGGQFFRKVVKTPNINVGASNMGSGNLQGFDSLQQNRGYGSGNLQGFDSLQSRGGYGYGNLQGQNLQQSRSGYGYGNLQGQNLQQSRGGYGYGDLQDKNKTDSSYRMNLDFDRIMNGKDKDIELQANDSIYIPFEMITVNVTGEVISPGHILWRKGWDVDDYLNAAGGLTITGDPERVVLTYANGSKIKSNKAKENPNPGSTIQVYYKPIPESIKWTEVVSAIGTLATAFATIALVMLR
jgi:protein involved in polysaccharide export with SLBB domain